MIGSLVGLLARGLWRLELARFAARDRKARLGDGQP